MNYEVTVVNSTCIMFISCDFNQWSHALLHQSIGAVNTIIRRHAGGKLVGYNTDCEASITAIEDALKGIEADTIVL